MAEIPLPSDLGVYIRALTTALLANMPRERAEAVLRMMAELLAQEVEVAKVLPMRASRQNLLTSKAARGAAALFRVHLATFLAGLRRK